MHILQIVYNIKFQKLYEWVYSERLNNCNYTLYRSNLSKFDKWIYKFKANFRILNKLKFLQIQIMWFQHLFNLTKLSYIKKEKKKTQICRHKKRLNISSFIYMYETCKYLHENYIKYDRAIFCYEWKFQHMRKHLLEGYINSNHQMVY